MKQIIYLFLFTIIGLSAKTQNADAILGKWINEKQTRTIEIYKNNDLYYGRVLSLKDSEKGVGSKRLDIKNPNSSLNNRKIIGIDFLMSFSYFTDRDVWKEGHIYNYETGNTYSGKLSINKDGSMDLTGYYGILWFLGRTQTLTRVTE